MIHYNYSMKAMPPIDPTGHWISMDKLNYHPTVRGFFLLPNNWVSDRLSRLSEIPEASHWRSGWLEISFLNGCEAYRCDIIDL